MNRYAKMMLMRSAVNQDRRDGDRRDYDRPDMRGGYSVPESRFRDRDGREHYDNGRYAPMSRGGQDMRSGYPMRWDGSDYPHSEYMEPYSVHPMSPYVPPMYDGGHWPKEDYRPMNRIGFSMDGEMERLPRTMSHDHRPASGHDGRYDADQIRPRVMPVFNRQMAEDWAHGMRNADGTMGPHWSMEKTKEVQKQYGINCDETEFWAVLNSIYSDYCEALKKNNASNLETYVCLAKAWIEDRDAVPNKAAAYFTYVVEH